MSFVWGFFILMIATGFGAYKDWDRTAANNDRARVLVYVSSFSGLGYFFSYLFYYVISRCD